MKTSLMYKEKDYEMEPDVPNIFEAASNDDVKSLEIALKHYPVNVMDENRMIPLHHAFAALAFNTTRRLLKEKNININAKDKFGREPAIMAEEVFGIDHPLANAMCDLIWKESKDDLLEADNVTVSPIRPEDLVP